MIKKLWDSSTLGLTVLIILIISMNHKLNLQLTWNEIMLMVGVAGIYTGKQGAVQVMGDKTVPPTV